MSPSRALLLPCTLLLGAALSAAPLEGVIQPFRQVEVSAPVSSRVEQAKVQEGEAVKAGQPLALLYAKLEELEAERTKALLERREFEAKGAKRLYDSKVIPESKAVECRLDLELARLQYEAAAEQVRLRTVLAPMDGVVVQRYREVGEAVSSGQPLFRLVDLSRVVVQCAADPAAVAPLAVGAKVRVRLPQLGEQAEADGEVTLVDPCADARGKVRVKVVVPNPGGRIRTGLPAQILLP
ncbi:efflux RND transporter periplasmic adaptor subunit [Geothrix sp. 21YS21S-4]|uniref:efflux RND transporter periplasmic adaptor subunit n=1 Tax=Geothrix sp. 21YS21S-4 TaxID=3068889 RepID=UPI0027BAF5CC|nr:efflux RND transporter periplasmic adaptor subunit [Geothrix sp. 21YS21S-4]